MAFFKLNWNLDGFRDKVHGAGEVLEADLVEVVEFVDVKFGGKAKASEAVLSPVDATEVASTSTVPGGDVDVTKLKKDELVAHIETFHPELEVSATATKPELVSLIETARTETPTA